MLRIIVSVVAALVWFTSPALSQNAIQGLTVASCGTPPISYTVGKPGPVTVDPTGTLCANNASSLTANQGTANTLANAWPVKVTDGTNGPVAVKPANTAPTTSDAGIVANINCSYSGAPCITLGPAAVAGAVPHVLSSQYPVNATTTSPTPITAHGTGTTGSVTATLATAASITTFDCGFSASAIGGTATVGPITITGLIGGTFTYELASLAAGNTLTVQFNPCIPASAVNTTISVATTADGTATAVAVNMWGYQL